MSTDARILYCHCAYAQVVPADVKDEVLRRLAESGVATDAVADLCELSAKRDPTLRHLVDGIGGGAGAAGVAGGIAAADGQSGGAGAGGGGELRIAACYPRAVKWLFNGAGINWPAAGIDVVNMRTESAEQVVQVLLNGRPAGQPAASSDDDGGGQPSGKVEEPSAA